jgi:hypothetical protein
MTYEEALATARKTGTRHASDEVRMALYCDASVQIVVGAVSPKLMWEGAQKRGMTTKELSRLCTSDPIAASELMW